MPLSPRSLNVCWQIFCKAWLNAREGRGGGGNLVLTSTPSPKGSSNTTSHFIKQGNWDKLQLREGEAVGLRTDSTFFTIMKKLSLSSLICKSKSFTTGTPAQKGLKTPWKVSLISRSSSSSLWTSILWEKKMKRIQSNSLHAWSQ